MTKKSPKVAFCITCKGRLEHIKKTLPRNLADNREFPNAVFVLLDYNSNDGLEDYIQRTYQNELISGRLVYYKYPHPENFRMAHAKNMAHRLGILEGGDILVNLDADNYTGVGFAEYIVNRIQLAAEDGEVAFMRARENHFGPGEGTARRMRWGCAGRIVVTKEAFLNAGGYDECYKHWSPDDKDFTARLSRLGYTRIGIRENHLRAIVHGDDLRFVSQEEDAPQSMDDSSAMFDLEGRAHLTVVNDGYFGVGSVFRNFDYSKQINLTRVPTRIFGIGAHKTATTSLHEAFHILGLDSAHWESPHWARNIWHEMHSEGRSRTLEAHYCLCDFPIPALFKELDQAYPGSKFVLTLRDEAKWIRSVERHWIRYKTTEWDKDAFSNEMHTAFYGIEEFDAEVMLNRYRQHTREVLAHFEHRPEDLLIMHMDTNPGWDALCAFINRPVPEVCYPNAFKTPHHIQPEPKCAGHYNQKK